MSLYIGRDENDNPLLHITKQETSDAESKSGDTNINTLFHSASKYFGVLDQLDSAYFEDSGVDVEFNSFYQSIFEPVFSPSDETKLRDYVAQGALIIPVLDEIGDNYVRSLPKLYSYFTPSYYLNNLKGSGSRWRVTSPAVPPGMHGGGITMPSLQGVSTSTIGVTSLMFSRGDAQNAGFEGFPYSQISGTLEPMRVRNDYIGAHNNSFDFGTENVHKTVKAQYPLDTGRGRFNYGMCIRSRNNPPSDYSTYAWVKGAKVYWDPHMTGLNTNAVSISNNMSLRGVRARLFVMNCRLTSEGNLEQLSGKPGSEINIKKDTLQVGGLDVKDSLLLADPDISTGTSLLANDLGAGSVEVKTSEVDNLLSTVLNPDGTIDIDKFFDLKQPLAECTISNIHSTPRWTFRGYLSLNEKALLEQPSTVELTSSELKLVDKNRTKEINIANVSNGSKLLNIVDEKIDIVVPGFTNQSYDALFYTQARWVKREVTPDYYHNIMLSSGDNYYYISDSAMPTIVSVTKLPDWAVGEDVLTIRTPVKVSGEFAVEQNGRRVSMDVDIFNKDTLQMPRLFLLKGDPNSIDNKMTIANMHLGAGDNISLYTRTNVTLPAGGYNTTRNKWCGFNFSFTAELDTVNGRLIIYRSGSASNQSIHAQATYGGWTSCLNKFGPTETVKFTMPEIRFSLVPIGK